MGDYLWVEDGDQIFIRTYNPAYCAHYGWEYHKATAIGSYLSGYKLAADLLIDKALDAAKAHHIEVTDTLVYPIVFICRQFIELSIKNIYINYSRVPKEESKEIFKARHNLLKAWEYIKPFAIEVSDNDEDQLRDVQIIEDYINQFEKVSKYSTEYRYPVDNENNVVLKEDTYLDLRNLKEKMQKFSNFFDGLCGVLDYYFNS